MRTRESQPTRVVVTGRGLVTPLGRSAGSLHERWLGGRSPAAAITKFDASTLPVRIACEVPDFVPRKEIANRKLLRLLLPGEDFGIAAAAAALTEARLTPDDYDPARAGIAIGLRKEGFRNSNFFDAVETALDDDGRVNRQTFIEDGMRRIPPQTIVEGLANAELYHIAHEHKLQGYNQNLLGVGAAGMLAIGEAMWALQRDEADLILAGSGDSWNLWQCLSFTHHLGIASTSTDPPHTVHRPFDRHRCGSVIGEGAAMFVLEPLARAVARGATVWGEILGFGTACGVPSHDPSKSVDALAASIRRALQVARLSPDDIDFVHLHGDATPAGDRIEVQGLAEAFGQRAQTVPVTTAKSVVGFMANASSSVELAAVLEVLRRQEIPPIVNLQTPDPQFSLAFVQEPLTGPHLRHALLVARSWPSQYTALIVGTGASHGGS